jgi:hypothetical protein
MFEKVSKIRTFFFILRTKNTDELTGAAKYAIFAYCARRTVFYKKE